MHSVEVGRRRAELAIRYAAGCARGDALRMWKEGSKEEERKIDDIDCRVRIACYLHANCVRPVVSRTTGLAYRAESIQGGASGQIQVFVDWKLRVAQCFRCSQ